jgi:hypothetical protein
MTVAGGAKYDVAVTFAGEDRNFVLDVVRLVKAAGFTVFFDEDEAVALWGEELTEFFAEVYEKQARFAVMFISRHYAEKSWTRHERRSVLLRALESPTPYLLPVRMDSTALSGVRGTISYLDGNKFGPEGVAEAIAKKVHRCPVKSQLLRVPFPGTKKRPQCFWVNGHVGGSTSTFPITSR